MQIGIGLPNPIPGTTGRTLLAWGPRAEARGFSTLATIDRIVYPNYDSLLALTAAAAVTSKIGLLTNVLLGPTRAAVVLAKQAASLDQISNGRFTLGIGVGGREDDFQAIDRPFKTRGQDFDAQLDLLHRAWKGEAVAGGAKAVAPTPVRDARVPVLIGGNSDAAMERTVKYGIGWTAGGAPPEATAPFLARIRAAWQAAGRSGQPRFVGLSYFGLGPNAEAGIQQYIMDYYGFLPFAAQMAGSIPRTAEAVRDIARRFADIGVDELIFDPSMAELEQIDLLADAVLDH